MSDGPIANYVYNSGYPSAADKPLGYDAVGPGWRTILECLDSVMVNLMENVISNATKAREEYREEGNTGEPVIKIGQIKEKFGGLRVYPDTIEGMSGRYKEEIWGAIRMAESMSYKMCEKCGSTEGSETRPKSNGKFSRTLTLCATHHGERDNSNERFEFGNGDWTV